MKTSAIILASAILLTSAPLFAQTASPVILSTTRVGQAGSNWWNIPVTKVTTVVVPATQPTTPQATPQVAVVPAQVAMAEPEPTVTLPEVGPIPTLRPVTTATRHMADANSGKWHYVCADNRIDGSNPLARLLNKARQALGNKCPSREYIEVR